MQAYVPYGGNWLPALPLLLSTLTCPPQLYALGFIVASAASITVEHVQTATGEAGSQDLLKNGEAFLEAGNAKMARNNIVSRTYISTPWSGGVARYERAEHVEGTGERAGAEQALDNVGIAAFRETQVLTGRSRWPLRIIF